MKAKVCDDADSQGAIAFQVHGTITFNKDKVDVTKMEELTSLAAHECGHADFSPIVMEVRVVETAIVQKVIGCQRELSLRPDTTSGVLPSYSLFSFTNVLDDQIVNGSVIRYYTNGGVSQIFSDWIQNGAVIHGQETYPLQKRTETPVNLNSYHMYVMYRLSGGPDIVSEYEPKYRKLFPLLNKGFGFLNDRALQEYYRNYRDYVEEVLKGMQK